jgi:hypothetical protein
MGLLRQQVKQELETFCEFLGAIIHYLGCVEGILMNCYKVRKNGVGWQDPNLR